MADCSKCIHIDVCGKLVFFGRNCNKECIHYNDGSNLVEVVRCKNCKHFEQNPFDGCEVCTHISGYVRPDFGCVDGERK